MVKKLISGMSLTGNGLRDWLYQRFSAIILAAYFCVVMGFIFIRPITFDNVKIFFTHPWMQIFTMISLFGLLVHAWVGIWTVITDYIKPISLRIILQVLVIFSLFIYFFWGIEILWR